MSFTASAIERHFSVCAERFGKLREQISETMLRIKQNLALQSKASAVFDPFFHPQRLRKGLSSLSYRQNCLSPQTRGTDSLHPD
jgi:hypothetical protein